MGNDKNIITVSLDGEMKKSYLDYAMSVIVGRALPDARDGLKPVHRRILFAMNEMGNTHNKPYKKSARIVGDVIGKFHPHGDMAVYDAIVRMVQDFSMRYPLIDGQGNFGSVDGDSAAAMRYTEIRMARIAEEMLSDIRKETVDFLPNYDESLQEPEVLPTRIPNLLINGSSGIAVGMATNIPPHNLGEIIDALVQLISYPGATVDELMNIVPGPDFPTAAFIYGKQGIKDAYKTGRGVIKLRARAAIEEIDRKRTSIIITELPFQVNKSKLIEQIAELVKGKKIDGISDIRDESDRDGMRVVIELKRDEEPEIILNNLFKHTQMQVSFGINLLAIVRNQPRVLNLKSALEVFLEHRKNVVTRRTRYELRKAKERAHILEGLKIALDNLDAVIKLIRKSRTPAEAKDRLCSQFSLTPVQAQAILDMKLQRLTNMEREKIVEEYNETLRLIASLEDILSSTARLMQVVKSELIEIRNKYADKRRTEILDEHADISIEDLIPDENSLITISHTGYIKRTPADTYRVQHRGGKGRRGMSTHSTDFTEHAFVASNHSFLLIFTDKGKVYWLKVYEIPQVSAAGKGRSIVNLVRMEADERITDIVSVKDFKEDEYVIFATSLGIVKKTPLSEFSNPRTNGIIAQTIKKGDQLISVCRTNGKHDVFLSTAYGQSIRFHEEDVRPMGRTAQGVIGIRLKGSDRVVSMTTFTSDGQILTVTKKGYGKKTSSKEYRVQGRGGSGIKNLKVTSKNGEAVGVRFLLEDSNLIVVTAKGQAIRMNTESIRSAGRATMGVKLIDLSQDDVVTSFTILSPQENNDDYEPDESA